MIQERITSIVKYVQAECFWEKLLSEQIKKHSLIPKIGVTKFKGFAIHEVCGFRFNNKKKDRQIAVDITIYLHGKTMLFLLNDIQVFIHRHLIVVGGYDREYCETLFLEIEKDCIKRFPKNFP